MESCILIPPRCFANREDVSISGKLFDLLSTHTYDGEGEVAWLEHLHNFLSMIYEEDEFTNKQASLLLVFTLRESPFRWVLSLPANSMHSCEHFCDIVEDTFLHFDPYHLDWKLLQQWRAPHEFFIDFWSTSMTYCFKFPGARWSFLIFGTSLSITLRNIPIPRESLRSSLAQPSSLMELCNLMWE